jgi:hypothetical protein
MNTPSPTTWPTKDAKVHVVSSLADFGEVVEIARAHLGSAIKVLLIP